MDPIMIPIMALSIPIVAVPSGMISKYLRRARELEHIERMQAIQLGRVLPRDEPWWTPARISVAIGVVVPLGTMIAGVIATAIEGYHQHVWITAGIIGLGAVVTGGWLAFQSGTTPPTYANPVKAEFDPDSFDVVGRRG